MFLDLLVVPAHDWRNAQILQIPLLSLLANLIIDLGSLGPVLVHEHD